MPKIPPGQRSLIARYIVKTLDLPESKFKDIYRSLQRFDYDPNYTVTNKKFERPSGYRQGNKRQGVPGVRKAAWDAAKNEHDEVIDPLTKQLIREGDKWDMGHKPGHEYHKQQQLMEHLDKTLSDSNGEFISRQNVLDIYQQSDDFRPELPSSNRSHKGEGPADLFWPGWQALAEEWR